MCSVSEGSFSTGTCVKNVWRSHLQVVCVCGLDSIGREIRLRKLRPYAPTWAGMVCKCKQCI